MNQISDFRERMRQKFQVEKQKCTGEESKRGWVRAAIYAGLFGYLELAFHLWIYHKVDLNLWNGILQSVVFGVIVAVFTGMFGERANRYLGRTILGIVSIYYMVQVVYYHVFLRFLNFYSIGAVGTDALEFTGEIKKAIYESLVILLILAVPFLVHSIVLHKYWLHTSKKSCNGVLAELFTGALCLQLLFLGGLFMQGTETYSAYELYHHWVQDMGTEKLGLLQTAIKDFQGLIGTAPEDEIKMPVEEVMDDDDYQPVNESEESQEVMAVQSPQSMKQVTPEPLITKEAEITITPEAGEEMSSADSMKPEAVQTTSPTPMPEVSSVDPIYNQIPLNFSAKGRKSKKKAIKDLDQYFSRIQPTKKNEYTGKFKGYNLILLTAEGFSPWAVDEKITPTLYRLTHEGFVFKNFYIPLWWCSTSDGEYVVCHSLIPKGGVTSMFVSGSNYIPFTLGNQLRRYDYDCFAYHDHSYTYYRRDVSHPNMGYTYKGVGNGLNLKKTWPESDIEMMEKTIPEYINKDQFHVYYMTVSGHMNYSFQGNMMSYKNRDAVADLKCSSDAKAYVACNVELDRALEYLITQLEKAGVADRTVIALSADHYPYGLEKSAIDELAGHKVENNFELYKNHFILWNPQIKEPIEVMKPCCSLDILPTLSNLFGIEYDSRLMVGHDIFSDSEPLVIFSNRSFITDKVMYNSTNKKVTYLTKEELPKNYLENKITQVKNQFTISKSILENDYYRRFEEFLNDYWNDK